MQQPRWPIVLGPPLLIAVAVLAVAVVTVPAAMHLQAAADARPKPDLPALTACAASPVTPGEPIQPSGGSWWKTVEQVDASGTLTGRRLFVGRGTAAGAAADLPVESSASGPVGGIVVVTADDGARSEIRLVAIDQRCGWVLHRTASVVRSAILDPADGTVFFHLVDRSSRADTGTWRVASAAGGGPILVAPPLGPAGRQIGAVWTTELALDELAARLIVQSCGDVGCVARIFDLADPGSAPAVLRDPAQGALLGLAGDQPVTWARCPGLPCAVVAWDPATGRGRVLIDQARAAALTRDGRRLVASVVDVGVEHAVEIDPATGTVVGLPPFAAGGQPLRMGLGGVVGLEVAVNEVVVAPPGGDPSAFNPDAAAEVVP